MILGGADEAFLERPLADVSRSELADLFNQAAKPETEWYVGLEVEVLPHRKVDLGSPDYPAMARLLERLAKRRNMSPETTEEGQIIGLKGDGQLISLEPGGQIEFASRPHRALKALKQEVLAYCQDLRTEGACEDMGFWRIGHQPLVLRETAPRMPQARYHEMRRYFTAAGGKRALDMMHLTGSVQTTVDFQNEANLVNKVRTAAKASPFIAALCAASPFSNGKPNGLQTERYQIWLDTDHRRAGLWPEMFDEEGLRPIRYVNRVMATPPMFFIRDGAFRVPDYTKPFEVYVKEGFEGEPVRLGDFLDHLTTFFPEIRPKGYVELRGADCLPGILAVGVAGLWRGILDEENTRQTVDEKLRDIDFEAARKLQIEVIKHGLRADSPAGPVAEVAKWLMRTAYERLNKGASACAECLMPLLEIAESGRSPADRMLEVYEKADLEAALELYVV